MLSDDFIKSLSQSNKFSLRNSVFYSLFRAELIETNDELGVLKPETLSDDIWILTNTRSAIQQLNNWSQIGTQYL